LKKPVHQRILGKAELISIHLITPNVKDDFRAVFQIKASRIEQMGRVFLCFNQNVSVRRTIKLTDLGAFLEITFHNLVTS
jgi:hypothetical protein